MWLVRMGKAAKSIWKKYGLNVFNLERYKYGGVRHTSLDYALFDLEQFLKLPKILPSDEDKIILKRILDCVYNLESKDMVGKLRSSILKKNLKVIKMK